MYRLETFGGLALLGAGRRGLAQQRRRLALLALLAAAGERGLSRDRIVACLWPESDAEAGRHALEQLVHAVRRTLGESVFSGVNPLALNPAAVASDVAEFEHAFAQGELTVAAALYRGPFLNGFYLEDGSEFERWTEAERARFAGRHVEMLQRLGDDAETAGDVVAAAGWRKQLVEADPLSSRHALAYMRALVARGDRAAALQHARVHETLVRQELDCEPDPSVASYVAELRVEGFRDVRPVSVPTVTTARLVSTRPSNEEHASPSESPVISLRAVSRKRRASVVAGMVIAATLLVVTWSHGYWRTTPSLDPNTLVVLPFSISGSDSSVSELREKVVDLLAPMLTGEGGPIGVDSRKAISVFQRVSRGRDANADIAREVARDVGAGRALFGTFVLASGRLTVTANLLAADNGALQPLTSVAGSPDSLQSMLDKLLHELLVRQAGVPEETIQALMTASLPALRPYLDGWAAHRRAHSADAIRDFTRALDVDSKFVLAALDLATATTKVLRQQRVCVKTCRSASVVPGFRDSGPESDDAQFDRAVRLAWQSRAKLGRRDLALLTALRGTHWPRISTAREALADLEQAVTAAPDRAETQYLFGLLMLYQGPAIGYSDALVQAEARFRKALELDSGYVAPRARLADVAAYQGDTAQLRKYGTEYLTRDSAGATADYVRWRLAVGTGDSAAARQIRARFDSFDLATLTQIVTASQMSGVALGDADRASALIVDRTTDPWERSSALYWGHMLALNRGRPRQADSLLRLRRELDAAPFAQAFTTWAALFGDGDQAAADTSARARTLILARDTVSEPAHPPDSSSDQATREGYQNTLGEVNQEAIWRWMHGFPAVAATLAGWSRRHGDDRRADVVDMLIATDGRRPYAGGLRARVDSAAHDGCCSGGNHQIDLLLAIAYERAGEDGNALRAVRRGQWRLPTMFLAAYLRMEGRLADRVGDRAGAIRAYQHYLALRADPEPQLRAQRDSVQAELMRIKTATRSAASNR
jgi:DNA-binding SARP family transcriptional activator